MFVKAEKHQRKLKLAMLGPTGAGKTMSSLRIARGIAGPTGRIALIDTENHSASLYADRESFDVLSLTTFGPSDYIRAIDAAVEAKYDVLVIDSLTHAWSGKGGILEKVDRASSRPDANKFAGWRDATPEHNRLVDALVQSPIHLIVTMRVKMEYVLEPNERGKMVPVKKGLQPVQRDGLEYEFDLTADIDVEHNFSVAKTRFSDVDGFRCEKVDHTFGERLVKWLNSGTAVPPAQPQAPKAAAGDSDTLGTVLSCDPFTKIVHNGKDVVIYRAVLDPAGEFFVQSESVAAELGTNIGAPVVVKWRANAQGKRVIQSVALVPGGSEVPSAS